MSTQSEQQLENALITQLETLGWDRVTIKDEADLVTNLKCQLELHNKTSLSDTEFKQVLNKLARGNIFEKAKILRDKVDFTRDDGTTGYIELVNQRQWCKNQYQVTNQVAMEGSYKNRYDVTLLVNGLPLVQVELKRRGLEMKEADQPLPPAQFFGRIRALWLLAAFCHQQWGQHEVLCQQPGEPSRLQTDLFLGR